MRLPTESEIIADLKGSDTRERSDNEVVIRVEGVAVEYIAPNERFTSLKEYAIKLLQRRVVKQKFKALTDISLEIRRGEVFGLIGHNGAGKSTLLKVISRVLKPTRGRVWVKGRVAPLIELGAGFHPELSGRENIFLNGTLLGYRHEEMESQFDNIVDFAEMRDFIDSPQRTYSTGMTVRLGFAVATAFKPDILIVDEVLAVGDERFREKCWTRMNEFREGDTTILLVTHNSEIIRSFCDRTAWIDHGELRAIGDPAEVTKLYYEAYHPSSLKQFEKRNTHQSNDAASVPEQISTIEKELLEREWNYRFVLPGGGMTKTVDGSPLKARLEQDRLEMLYAAIQPQMDQRWDRTTCLDLGCNQGFFAFAVAKSGCRQVVGIDHDQDCIADAGQLRKLYDLPNLSFRLADLMKINEKEFDKFDIVLMMGLLSSLENPIAGLRKAAALTKRMLLIETEVLSNHTEISQQPQERFKGAFGLIEAPENSGGFSLLPSTESLIWLLKQTGFHRVDVLPPPADACEELKSGNRVFIAAYI